MRKIKLDRNLGKNLLFICALIVFVIIVFNLSTNAFIVVVPIFAGIVFLAILLYKEDEEKDKK